MVQPGADQRDDDVAGHARMRSPRDQSSTDRPAGAPDAGSGPDDDVTGHARLRSYDPATGPSSPAAAADESGTPAAESDDDVAGQAFRMG